MTYTKEQRAINSVLGGTKESRNSPKFSEGNNNFVLPNKSGEHVRSIKRETPVSDIDLVNKKYVDDEITSESATLSAEIDSDIATHASNASAHHVKYTDAEAVSAVSTADDYLKNDGDTATGNYAFDTNLLYIDATNDRIGFGTTTPSVFLTLVKEATYMEFRTEVYSNTNWHGSYFTLAKARGTEASPSAMQNGDTIGSFRSIGWNGSTWKQTSEFAFQCDAALSGGNIPTSFLIGILTASGWKDMFCIKSSGFTSLGGATPATSGALDIQSTTGALIVPRMTAAQIAALTATNGMICYDTTNNKFQFYENGAWVSGSGLA